LSQLVIAGVFFSFTTLAPASATGAILASAPKAGISVFNKNETTVSDLKVFYTESPQWHEKIGGIHALLERVQISEEQSGDILRLRKLNRILSVHASTAIEGNRLTLGQVTDVINGKPVWGPSKDIKEVQNAWRAYNAMAEYDPWRLADLLQAHAHLTETLVGESGAFRSVGVAVVRGDGTVMHRGAPPEEVPSLVKNLLHWGKNSEAHPIIKSSAVHYMLEDIHPFRDGNGRIGRLWQTLILSRWNPLFAWMPVETIVHNNQAAYYQALQDSHVNGVDCRPFIDFMLEVIKNSLHRYIETDFDKITDKNPDKITDILSNPEREFWERIIPFLREKGEITNRYAQTVTGKSQESVKKYFARFVSLGLLEAVGEKKGRKYILPASAMPYNG
jgi:Fic family protein